MARDAGEAAEGGEGGGVDDRDVGLTGDFDDNDVGLLDAFEDELDASEADAAEFNRPTRKGKDGKGAKDGKPGKGKAAKGEENQAAGGDEDSEGEEDDDGDEGDEESDADEDDGDDNDAGEGDGDPEGDYVEHEGAKIAVGDLVAAYNFQREVNGTVDQIRQQAETHFRGKAEAAIKVYEERATQAEQALELVKALMPKLDKPPTSMLDKSSSDYDPDSYHFLLRAHEQLNDAIKEAEAGVAKTRKSAMDDANSRRQGELQKHAQELIRRHPEFGDREKRVARVNELKTFVGKAYGFSERDLDAIQDARVFSVLLDAMELHNAKAKGAPKPKEEGKKPRLVRAGARETPDKGKRGASGKQKQDALAFTKRTGRIRNEDLESVLGDFVP